MNQTACILIIILISIGCLQSYKWLGTTVVARGIHRFEKATELYFDAFGLGPSEVIAIVGASVLLFGPDQVKNKFRKSGAKGALVSKGWSADRSERISDMQQYAQKQRNRRAMVRIKQALVDEEPYVVEMVTKYKNDKRELS